MTVNEEILFEQPIFNYISYYGNILSSLNIKYIEIMSLNHFEKIFFTYPIRNIVQYIVNKWNTAYKHPCLDNFRCIDSSELRKLTEDDGINITNSRKEKGHINKAFDEIFPGISKYHEADSG